MKPNIPETRIPRANWLNHLALAVSIGMAMAAGNAQAQAVIDVGGAGTIGDTVLPSGNKVPAGGVNWTVVGGTGAPVSSTLVSPAAVVPAAGNVTLTFTHRYDFEGGWDGGGVLVSVNGNPATYLGAAAFSSNGYTGTTTTNGSVAWAGGEDVFTGQSTDYAVPSFITSVADLGALNAGDTVSIQFKGEWDQFTVNGPPAWEIATVKLTDVGATDFLDADFTADGPSGFTVSNGGAAGPWTYLQPTNRFELDAVADTADRYAPTVAGSVINLNNANIQVVVLAGTLTPGDSFTLFDLSGGTTLSGSVGSISLPVGVWDTTSLATTGTITYVSGPTETLYTGPNGAYNNDTWNNAANWSVGIPSGTINAVIDAGRHAGVAASTTPVYTGNLTLGTNAQLTIGEGSTITGLRALGTGSITFNTGSRITLRWSTASTHSQNFIMAGDATFAIGSSTAAHNDDRTLTGVISGAGQMIVRSTNGQRLTIQNTNPSWSGGLIMGGALSENKNESLRANAAGAFGTGNVTIDDGVGLLIDVANAIDDTATLSLSGGDGEQNDKLTMNAADTVNQLVVDGYPQPAGTYGRPGSGATFERTWIEGAALLTVTSAATDTTAPTVTFAGTGAGGSTTDVFVGEPVTYTVTFSEPHTPALTVSDLENSTATPVTVNSVTPLSLVGGMTTLSYRVVATPTAAGSLNLQIKSGTVINDLFGNALVVPVADNDTLNVNALPSIEGQLGVWKPWANGGINPATGNPWQVGDTYRLAFVTTTTGNATSTDIATYNAFVQAAAASSTAFPDLGSATWKVLGSTATVAARDNTGTNPTTDGAGVAVILMDGSTIFATNNTDLWDGSPARPDVAGIFMSPYFNQEGIEETTDHSVYTGSTFGGVQSTDGRVLGGNTSPTDLGKVTTGKVRPNNSGRWMIQFNAANTSNLRFFALSEPLTLQAIGGPSNPYTTWALTNAPNTGNNPAADEDGDGVSNGLEFVLKGTITTNDLGKLPTVATTPGGDMTFTFVRDQDSVDASVAVSIEVGTTLASWPDVYPVPDAAPGAPPVAVVDNGDGTDTVTLTLTRAPDTEKFARLKVVITTP
jgi:hypothetical protein